MKKFLYVLLCLLLIAGIGGSAVLLAKNINSDTQIEQPDDSLGDVTPDDSDSGSGNSGNNNSGGNNGGNSSGSESEGTPTVPPVVEQQELVDPANVSQYIADGLNMVSGASIYLGEEEYEPSIRFTCNVTSAVKEAVDNDANKSLAFLIAPVEHFDSVNVNNYTYMDWVTALNNAGKTIIYSSLEESNFYANGDNYYVRFRLNNVMYKNINRNFVCMLVLATNSGNTTTYQYSKLPDGLTYRSNARSIAYVASAALNAHTLGLDSFSDEQVAKLKGYVNQSVDLANGLSEATDDGSMYAFNVSPTGPKTVSVGQTFKVDVEITPDVNVPVWYRSTDTSVVTVDDNGNVKALKAGTAVIGVYVAGEAFGITVTVS